ncbi:TPA: hypothetical protein RRG66_005489 [Klebsiella pneumoniae]|nr:hypothetical protein [Klebsiella pneumoniae]
MTTDITELLQREKFEAWVMTQICISKSTLEGLRTADGYRNTTLSGTDYNRMWNCWKAAGAELVEALESEKRICATWRKTAKSTGEKLEKAQAKADVYDMLRDDYGLREKGVGLTCFVDWQAKRIAELESRTVTVKLPHRNLGHEKLFLLCPFPYYDAEDMEKALAAAGFKVEAE